MTKQTVVHDAATVILLRDRVSGLETWLMTRAASMAFAPGASVFPGGRVEDTDSELPLSRKAGLAAAARLSCPVRLARGILGAAAREVFEESGVLLASPVSDLTAARADVEAGRRSFGALLREERMMIDSSRLRPWSRWITPAGRPRRYDTRFLVCAIPPGSEPQNVSKESSAAAWVNVSEALEQAQRGDRLLLAPTLVTLRSLRPYTTVTQVLSAADDRSLEPIEPKIRQAGKQLQIELPDGEIIERPSTNS